METSNYLGTERIGKLLTKFCIPCIASLIISCLYNIVDQIFVGNGIGYLGNAATGVIFPITVIGWGMSLFFGDGAAAYLSVAQGRNETKTVHRGIGNSILFSFLSGVVIILISYLWGDGLLRLIGATDATIALAHDYGKIIYIMMPLAMTQNTLASIIRADGSPRYAMGAMLVGALINIVGDPLAIFVLDLGIKGAAYATILGQFVSFLICAAYLLRSKTFRLRAESFRIDIKQLKQIMALGTSSLLTQLSIVVITVVNNILLVKYGAASVYGADIPLAAFVVIMKLFQIVLNIAIGIAAGAQPIVGYNYGAQKLDRVRELLKAVIKWTAIVGVVCMFLFEVFPNAFIRLFGSDGELYMEFAVHCLRIYLLLILFTCVQKVCAIFLQSIGRAQAAAPLAILRDLLLIVFSILMPIFLGVTGIFWAAPIADVIAMLITAVVMLRLWRELQAAPQTEAVADGSIRPSRAGVIVTISREHGSAGKRIGQLLAEMLRVSCYYKEVTALAAQESGLAAEFISDINKNSPERLKELYMSTTIVQQAVVAQDKIIKKIADNGSCVIVGRAADYVLREHSDVVRIFIHAPKAYRIKKVMEMYGDTRQQAEKNLAHSDAARANYYQSVTGTDWAYSDNYDLCIDSSIGEQASAEIILGYLQKKGYAAEI
ncbi:MAG: MATE family efflux transporter [Roseburia sp.]|nr:MATE family efflux transporter [Roseburia sp.]